MLHNTLPSAQLLPGAPLACFGVNGTDSRVYYIDLDSNTINELAWVGSTAAPDSSPPGWVNNPLPNAPLAPFNPTVPPTPFTTSLACFGVNGTNSRVYYYDADDTVNELAWVGTDAAPDSSPPHQLR